jgi:hypothetical protein
LAAITRGRRGVTSRVGRIVPDRNSPVIAIAPSSAADSAPMIAGGLTNNEIAGRLVISPLTAKTHVGDILRKVGCRDRAALVALAYESGLISPR